MEPFIIATIASLVRHNCANKVKDSMKKLGLNKNSGFGAGQRFGLGII